MLDTQSISQLKTELEKRQITQIHYVGFIWSMIWTTDFQNSSWRELGNYECELELDDIKGLLLILLGVIVVLCWSDSLKFFSDDIQSKILKLGDILWKLTILLSLLLCMFENFHEQNKTLKSEREREETVIMLFRKWGTGYTSLRRQPR